MKSDSVLAAMLASVLLTACAVPGPLAELVAPPEPRHRRDFSDGAARVCEASRYALLQDGYIVERHGDEGFVGARESHVKKEDKDDGYAHFRVYVTCLDRDSGGSTLFVTATEEHFGVKMIRESTLIGLPLVSPISVGSRTEGEQQVKFRGRTIEEPDFYDRFYKAVREELAPRKPVPR